MSKDPKTDEAPEIEEQGRLPLELPDYHGRPAIGMRTALAGAGNRIGKPTGLGDRTVLVIEVKTSEVGHRDSDDGVLYFEKRKVIDLFELDRDAGSRMLGFLRSRYKADVELAKGEEALPDLGDQGYADASGVVLLPEEVAERQGDPVRILTDESATPAVVVFEDHSRLLWPDEFPKGTVRPTPGVDLEDGMVVELLHHETGETMAWLASESAPAETTPADPTAVIPTVDRAELEGVAEAAVLNEQSSPEIDAEVEQFAEQIEQATSGEVPGLPDAPEAEQQPYDDGASESWDDADNVRRLPTAGEREAEQLEVTKLDVGFVDCTLPKLREKLDLVEDVTDLRRYIEAEKQGRGRGSDPRKGALDALYSRLAELGADAPA